MEVCQTTGPASLSSSQFALAAGDEERMVQEALKVETIPNYSHHLISFDRMAQELSSPRSLNGSLQAQISAYLRQHLNSPFIQEAEQQMTAFRAAQAENLFRVTVLSTSSEEGITLKAKTPKQQPLFVIKVPKPLRGKIISLAHEAVIGLLIANQLRRVTPCFMYTYSYAHCSLPRYVNKTVVTWCDQSGPGYTVLEYIPGRAISDLLPDMDQNQTYKVMLCLYLSLKLAYEKYRFIHGDLHGGNVMVRDMGQLVKIQIGQATIVTRYVPYIIDFGFSSVRLDGVNIISSNARGFADPDLTAPLYDLCRLLLSLVPFNDQYQVIRNVVRYSVFDAFYQVSGRDYYTDATHFLTAWRQGTNFAANFIQQLYQSLKGVSHVATVEDSLQDPKGVNMPLTPIYSEISSCDFIRLERQPESATDLCDLAYQGKVYSEEVKLKVEDNTVLQLMHELPMPNLTRIRSIWDLPNNYVEQAEDVARVQRRAEEIDRLVKLKDCGINLSERHLKDLRLKSAELHTYLDRVLEINRENRAVIDAMPGDTKISQKIKRVAAELQ